MEVSKKNKINTDLVIFFISTILFLVLAFYVYFAGRLNLDYIVNDWIPSIQNNLFTPIAEFIDLAFDTIPLLVVALIASAYICYKGSKKNSAILAMAMIGDAGVLEIVKNLVKAVRPANSIVQDAGFGFPSGHSASIIVFLGIFLWIYWDSLPRKKIILPLCILAVLIIGFSRLYLNVHWFSDILGGYLLGLSLLSGAILIMPVLIEKLQIRKSVVQ